MIDEPGRPAARGVETGPPQGSGAMFDRIAHRYDLLNRVMSLGIDQSWRRSTIAELRLDVGARVLDLATGTGDMALLALERHPEITVEAIDPSEQMIIIGRKKARERGIADDVQFRTGQAEDIPFSNLTFNAVMIAFGIRNVTDRPRALLEMARVTKNDGRVAVLELTEPRAGWTAPFARFYMHHLVPATGALLSGSREYRYLQQSIEQFPESEEFCRMLERAGLEVLEARRLTFGVCHLFVARPSR